MRSTAGLGTLSGALATSPNTAIGIPYSREGRHYQRCIRCGIERQVQTTRHTLMCSDCKSVDPHFGTKARRLVEAGKETAA